MRPRPPPLHTAERAEAGGWRGPWRRPRCGTRTCEQGFNWHAQCNPAASQMAQSGGPRAPSHPLPPPPSVPPRCLQRAAGDRPVWRPGLCVIGGGGTGFGHESPPPRHRRIPAVGAVSADTGNIRLEGGCTVHLVAGAAAGRVRRERQLPTAAWQRNVPRVGGGPRASRMLLPRFPAVPPGARWPEYSSSASSWGGGDSDSEFGSRVRRIRPNAGRDTLERNMQAKHVAASCVHVATRWLREPITTERLG